MSDRSHRRAGEGEKSAFNDLLPWDGVFFSRMSRQLADFLVHMDVPLWTIDDLIAEAWLKAVTSRHQLAGVESERQLYGWLRKVVQRLALDWKRGLATHGCQTLPSGQEEPSDDRPAQRAEIAEQLEQLHALLERAGPGHERSVHLLRMHYFAGFSIPELAQQFGMTAKSVDGRIRRLVAKLRALAK